LYVLFIFLSKKSDYGVNPNKRRVPGSCYITFNRNISQSKHEYYWPCVQNSVTRSFNNGTETRVHLRLLSSIRKTSSKKRSIRKTSSKKRSIIPLLNFFLKLLKYKQSCLTGLETMSTEALDYQNQRANTAVAHTLPQFT
jgi:hypothetical protein